ncbi:MAG TPA: glycosyltransferase family 39 protein [Polyangiales bacterium]|nr:glycosyltransferase family 39 protein [Polyangiales bacterium]
MRLLLVDAGPAIHFEHLRAAGALLHGKLRVLDAAGVAFFVLLFVVVTVAARAELRSALAALRQRLGLFGAGAVLALLLGTVALPDPNFLKFGVDVALSTLIRFTLIGLTWLSVRDLPASWREAIRARVAVLLADDDAAGELAKKRRRIPIYAAAFSFVASSLLCLFSYQRVPHIPDEIAYLFHARYFATGHLSAPVPPVIKAFEVYLVGCEHGQCTSPFPPGWPAILSLGVLAHVPWLVNPLLGALNVMLLYWLARLLWGERVAVLSAVLLAVSPWHLLMSMSFMSHVSSLGCALFAAWCVAKAYRTGTSWQCCFGGLAIGVVSLSRPLESVVVAGVLGLAALLYARGTTFRFAPVVLLGGFTALLGALNRPYNAFVTGDPKLFPVTKYMDMYWGKGKNDLGFGANRDIRMGGIDPFPGHGLRDVIVNSQICTSQMQTELFGWGAGSLWLAVALFVLRAQKKLDWWPVLWLAAVAGSQSLYWFSGGPDFGARYWYTAIVPLVILSARGLVELESRSTSRSWSTASVLMVVAALGLFIPWRAIDKYYHFRTEQPGMRDLLASRDFGRSLLIIHGKERPDYASAINFTPIDPNADAPLIYWGRTPEVERQLMEAYADRPIYIVDGPSLAGGVYRVVRELR